MPFIKLKKAIMNNHYQITIRTGWFIKNGKFGNWNTTHEMVANDANMPDLNVVRSDIQGVKNWNFLYLFFFAIISTTCIVYCFQCILIKKNFNTLIVKIIFEYGKNESIIVYNIRNIYLSIIFLRHFVLLWFLPYT